MEFAELLFNWYSKYKRKLPWRETGEPYHIWLSEIILQQTQVNQGLPYYRRFVQHFPTLFDLAEADEQEVLKLWQGLGYYSRARNLHATAKIVVDDYRGIFPTTYSKLIKLKGIGDYTASAIASICSDEHCAVVDGNVYRLLSRYFGIETPIDSGKGKSEFKQLAQTLLPRKSIGMYNQAIMEFGSRQCKPKNPECGVCPLRESCVARQKNAIGRLPVKLKRTKIRKRYLNYLVPIAKDKTILEQRNGKDIWKGLYQFPMIESERALSIGMLKEHPDLKEMLNETQYKISLFNTEEIIHRLSHQQLHTRFWIIDMEDLPVKGIALSEIKNYPVPTLIGNFLETFNF